MDPLWATEHLQVIRTLMERAAVYRRALAPLMTTAGGVGIVAAAAALFLDLESAPSFSGYWLSVSLLVVVLSFLQVRRQALQDHEPIWSPPVRRVAQAVAPVFACGFLLGILVAARDDPAATGLWVLPPLWAMLYGCALHTAGFFMPRGMKLFGWLLVVTGGATLIALSGAPELRTPRIAHGLMGASFGMLQFLYGVYLYFTERRSNEM